jgi:integrase/recombinase XerC
MEKRAEIESTNRNETTTQKEAHMTVEPRTDQSVQFTLVYQQGKLTECVTSSTLLNHFLDVIKLSRTYNTWVNYAYDLKTFFEQIPKSPETINRKDCLAFMRQQQDAGLSSATINRRLAALSSLFKELQLVGVVDQNPVQPGQAGPRPHRRSQSLYRQPAKRLPETIPEQGLQRFFSRLPTWRDRTLVLLMWTSCLRVSEVVAIQFEHIECSRHSISIMASKGGHPRLVFMEPLTFATLNRYLDDERGDLFPEVPEVFIAFKGKARGQPLSVNAVQKLVKYYAQKCGLPNLHPHLFRHTGITQLVRNKMAEPALRQFVGHRHPDSLVPYLHLGDDFIENEFEQAQQAPGVTNWLKGGEG